MQSTTLLVHLVFESIMEKVGNKLTPVHVLHIFQIRLHHTKFQGKKFAASEIKRKITMKTLAVISLTRDIEAIRLKENKVERMDHSPGWGNICCLREGKWSARKQLR